MLLINRDSVIFFCNFFIRIKIPQLCKNCRMLFYGRVQKSGGLRRQTFLDRHSCLPAYGRKR